MTLFKNISIDTNNASWDSFSRLRVSLPENVFNVQCWYSPASIQMESYNTGLWTIPTHNTNTRMVALVSTGVGTSWMQSFLYIPYQPSKSQFIAITWVIWAWVTGATVDMWYGDSKNGVFFRQNWATLQVVIRSYTSGSMVERVINQSSWNIDKMLDGTWPSWITLDITKSQILIIDLQFLWMGRVRVWFDINWVIYYVHEFMNANTTLTEPYMQTGSLPISMQVTTTSWAKTSYFKCAAVNSEWGNMDLFGYLWATPDVSITASTRTPLVSIRPWVTFKWLENRQYCELIDIILIATGQYPVYRELVAWVTLTGATRTPVNPSFFGMEYTSVAWTISSTTNSVVIASWYIAWTGAGNSPSTVTPFILPPLISRKFPLSLNKAGAVRNMGTYTLLVSGIWWNSVTRWVMNFKEIR